jgi:DNA-binding CsgD family transcriptional regulator
MSRSSLKPQSLSARERQVLTGMSFGLTQQQIARWLNLKIDTVKTHASRIYGKLNARGCQHAIRIGFEQGILTARDTDPSTRRDGRD